MRHDPRHARARVAQRRRPRPADVVHHRGHRDLRERDTVMGQLARHRHGEDGRVDGSAGLVEVLVPDVGHAEERGGRALREVDQALGHALDAPREDVTAGLQVGEEAPHDDDRGRVGPDDLLLEGQLLDLEPAEAGRVGHGT